jgi:NADP-dependent 3-hydroxy acid dehydrogenase YdfG
MLLQDKVAVIYGAGGAVGGAVARAFAAEGARLFLTGRKLAPVEAVAKDVVSAGGSAEAAQVDALDEQAVDKHLQSVIDKAGHLDISFDAIGIPVRSFWVSLWPSWMPSGSPCRSRPTPGRTF